MNLQEFNTNFDLLYNNIASNQAPGLDEYEKSVFLTNAQLELVKNYFNPKGNKYQEGFDQSPKRQLDFSTITDLMVYNITDALPNNVVRFNEDSIVFRYNDNFLFVTSSIPWLMRGGLYDGTSASGVFATSRSAGSGSPPPQPPAG